MPMKGLPCCSIVTVAEHGDDVWMVALKHYDDLRDRVDQNEKGWIELDSVHGDGKLCLRLEDIRSLFKATAGYCAAREEMDDAARIRGEE